MKRLVVLTFFALSVVLVFGQGGKVNSAISYESQGKLDRAKEAIDLATVHEKTKGKAKTWMVRGKVYQAIAVTKDSTYSKLSPNPVQISLDAYKKALELDVKGRYAKEINKNLDIFIFAISPSLSKYWNDKDYKKAYQVVVGLVEMSALKTPPVIDTSSMYNAAIIALNAKMYDEAIAYYKKCIDLKYKEGAKMYINISSIEINRGDTAKAISYLEEGIVVYPDENSDLMVNLINLYLQKGESDLALKYLDKAIEKDPNNATFLFAKGTLYEKLGDLDKAKEVYEKSIEINPKYFNAYYNLGALYYNKAIEMMKKAYDIPAKEQKKYDMAVKEASKVFEEALPYFEKAYELNKKEKSTVAVLKEIYFKLRNNSPEYMEKYKEYNELLKTY